MSETSELTYESAFRNSPVAIIGILGILAAAAAAGWVALTLLPARDLLWPAVEIAVVSIVSILFLTMATTGRRRWTATGQALRVLESSKFSWLWPTREIEISLSDIRALRRVESGFDILLELETPSGMRRQLMQGFLRDNVGAMWPDKTGLMKFGHELRKRAVAAGADQATFQDGLGFWNRGLGLAVLWLLLLATLGLSALILYGLISGAHVPQGSAMQGLAFVLLLPVGVAYALYRSMVRRGFVLQSSAPRAGARSQG